MLKAAINLLEAISKDAVSSGMERVLAGSDVWMIWDETGREVGCMYFTPLSTDTVTIHGGFCDKKLAGKADIMKELIRTRKEQYIQCPLRRDRKGKLWAWWLKKCLNFEELEPSGEDVFTVQRKGNKQCLQHL